MAAEHAEVDPGSAARSVIDGATSIGVDLAWWGGRSGDLSSACETVVSWSSAGGTRVERVPLHGKPTAGARSNYSLPLHDAEAELIAAAIVRQLPTNPDALVVVSLDAPLQTTLVGLPERTRASSTGSQRRSCDKAASRLKAASAQPWRSAPQGTVQPGAPIPARVLKLVDHLQAHHGFHVWDGVTPPAQGPRRLMLEVFPGATIWALGAQGHYGALTPSEVGEYKAKELVSRDEARKRAHRVLDAFVGVLPNSPFSEVIHPVIEAALAAANPGASGAVRLGKAFDDIIDSGIALLTGAAWLAGKSTVIREEDGDGHIVVPGDVDAGAARSTTPRQRRRGVARRTVAVGAAQTRCPLCAHMFASWPSGWDSHAGSTRTHPRWHPEVVAPEERRRLYRAEFASMFTK